MSAIQLDEKIDEKRQNTIQDRPKSIAPSIEKYGDRPEAFKTTLQECLFVATCTMAVGLSSMTGGAITVLSTFVGRDLGMSTAEITWLSAASSLASGSFLLFFARLADLFGRRMLFLGSLFIFSVLALGAGFCKKPIQLDILCGLMGLTSAACVPPAQGLLSAVYGKPSRRKNAAFACFGAGNPLGFVFGMIAGGIATQIFSWRAAFWFLALIYFLFSIVACFSIPHDDTETQRLNYDTLKRFDVLGVILTIAGTGMFSAALSLGSDAPNGWKTGYVLALLIVGALGMFGFVMWERYYSTPLIDMNIFRDRNFSLLLTILLLGFLAFPIASFWLSLFFQRVWHTSPIMTAVYLLPMAIGGTIVNIIAGAILHRVSNKLLMGIAAVSYVISNLLYALNKSSYPYWSMAFLGQIFAVIGADLQFNVVNMYVMSSLSKEDQSVAGGLFQMVTRLCVVVGMGISTAIYDAEIKNPPTSGFLAGNPAQPYSAAFWYCTAASAASVFFVPFLTIKTQGHSSKAEDAWEEKAEEDSSEQDLGLSKIPSLRV